MTLLTDPMEAWLWRTTWQSVVLIGLVLAVQWVFRRRLEPRWRHALWFVVMLRLMMPVSPSSDLSLFNWIQGKPVAMVQQGAIVGYDLPRRHTIVVNTVPVKPAVLETASVHQELIDPKSGDLNPSIDPSKVVFAEGRRSISNWKSDVPTWSAFVPLLIWMLGVVAFAIHLAFVAGRIERKIQREQPMTDPGVLDLLKECQREVQISTPIIVLETSLVQSPALYGFLQPRLLLPTGLAARFTRAEWRFVFLHELAHVKRYDIAINWLAAALQAIHWFNPLVWFAFNRMRADRELACDALALRHLRGDERKPYGETILKLLDGFTARSPMPGLVGILENGAEIKGRIRMIARFQPAARFSLLAVMLVGTIALVGLTDAQPVPPPQNRPMVNNGNFVANQNSGSTTNASRRVKGVVMDSQTGAPLSRFRITLGLTSNGAFQQDPNFVRSIKDFSSPDGTFSMEFDDAQGGRLRASAMEASADGYSKAFLLLPEPVGGVAEVEFMLKRAAPLVGIVVTPDGRPVPGADLVLLDGDGQNNRSVQFVAGGQLRSNEARIPVHTSGPTGKFTFRSPPSTGRIIATSPKGFASVSTDEVWTMGRVTLQPFGRIEGVLQVTGAPTGRQELVLSSDQLGGISSDGFSNRATTADDGRFIFPMVPPGQVSLVRLIPMGPTARSYRPLTEIAVESGQTNKFAVQVTETILQGQVRFEPLLPSGTEVTIVASISNPAPQMSSGLTFEQMRARNQSAEWRSMWNTPRTLVIPVDDNGRFDFHAVSPGEHKVLVEAVKGKQQLRWVEIRPGHSFETLARGEISIIVPTNATPTLPINLGEIVLKSVAAQPATNTPKYRITENRVGVQKAPDADRNEPPPRSTNGQSAAIVVQGKVTDADTGLPIPAFWVFVGDSQLTTGIGFPPTYQGRAIEGQDGHFRLSRKGPFQTPFYVIQIGAEGYLPIESTNLANSVGSQELSFTLKKGQGPAGLVLLPDGNPAVGARVFLFGRQGSIFMNRPGEILPLGSLQSNDAGTPNATADKFGHFQLSPIVDARKLVIVHEQGYAEIPAAQLSNKMEISLPKYGRVKGKVLSEGKSAVGKFVQLTDSIHLMGEGGRPFGVLNLFLTAITDGNGEFEFEKVPPGERRAGLKSSQANTGLLSAQRSFEVRSAETVTVILGEPGQTIVGKVVAPKVGGEIDWQNDFHQFSSNLETPARILGQQPKEKDFSTVEFFLAAIDRYSLKVNEYWSSEEGRARQRNASSHVPVFADDGSFRISDVPPGSYKLVIRATQPYVGPAESSFVRRTGNEIGTFTFDVEVPPLDEANKNKPLDLGALSIEKK